MQVTRESPKNTPSVTCIRGKYPVFTSGLDIFIVNPTLDLAGTTMLSAVLKGILYPSQDFSRIYRNFVTQRTDFYDIRLCSRIKHNGCGSTERRGIQFYCGHVSSTEIDDGDSCTSVIIGYIWRASACPRLAPGVDGPCRRRSSSAWEN